jgi:hypothetical protein
MLVTLKFLLPLWFAGGVHEMLFPTTVGAAVVQALLPIPLHCACTLAEKK